MVWISTLQMTMSLNTASKVMRERYVNQLQKERKSAHPIRLSEGAGAGVGPGVPKADALVPAPCCDQVQFPAVVHTPVQQGRQV
jgi:hypothetical protein